MLVVHFLLASGVTYTQTIMCPLVRTSTDCEPWLPHLVYNLINYKREYSLYKHEV